MARTRSWLLTLLVAGPACRSTPEVGESGTGETALTGAPRLSRGARQDQFWSAHGITFDATFGQEWLPLGTEPQLELHIRNQGAVSLALPLVRSRGFFPFLREEKGQLDLAMVQQSLNIRYGSHREQNRVRVPDLERDGILVQPATEMTLSVPVPVRFGAADVLELSVEAQLFPLAVQFEGEPDRLVAIRFPASRVRFGPAEIVAMAGLGDMTQLAGVLGDRPERLPALAEMLADIDPIRVVDFLVQSLPGPTEGARLALLAALGQITGRSPGPGVEVWRGWWESEDAARWAMQQRTRRAARTTREEALQ